MLYIATHSQICKSSGNSKLAASCPDIFPTFSDWFWAESGYMREVSKNVCVNALVLILLKY